jgi:hypothetical protein
MRWHKWGVLIAGSTGSPLRAVRPPNLHITPDVRRDLVYAATTSGGTRFCALAAAADNNIRLASMAIFKASSSKSSVSFSWAQSRSINTSAIGNPNLICFDCVRDNNSEAWTVDPFVI